MLRYCSTLFLLVTLGACSYKTQKLDLNVGAASTLVLDRATASADGVEQVTATLSLKRFDGSPAPGLDVRLQISEPQDTLVHNGAAIDPNGTLATDANGQLVATFTSRVAGTKVLTSTLFNGSQTMQLRTASVTFGAPSHFPLLHVEPSNATPTAGIPFNVTLTVVDAVDSVQKGYLGTLLLTASDANAVLPAQVTFTPADAGVKILQGVIYKGAGQRYLTGTDTQIPSLTAAGVLNVQPAAVAGFQISVSGSPVAGQAAGITVTAVDAYNNIVPTYTGQVTLSANDPNNSNGVPAMAGTLTPTFGSSDQGQINLPGVLTLQRTDNQVTLTVTGPSPIPGNAPLSTTRGPFQVLPAAADHLDLSLDANVINAGDTVRAQLTARDVFDNVAVPYVGTVRLGSSDTRAVVPAAYTFNPSSDAGVHTFALTLKTANPNALITAQDANGAPPSAAAVALVVRPVGPYLSGTWNSNPNAVAVAGSAQTLDIRAYDMAGNPLTTYNGTVSLTSTDANAVLGAAVTLTAGVGSAPNLVHKTAGPQYVTLEDTQDATLAGTSHVLTVTPGPAAIYALAGGNAIAGAAYTFGLTVQDAYGNIASGYTGRAKLTTTDSRAILVDRVFTANDAGVAHVSMLFKTAGVQAVNANDSMNSAVSGSLNVAVAPGVPDNFALRLNPNNVVAGNPVTASVHVRDAYGNDTPSYTGTLAWHTNNANALLPPSYTFTASDAGVQTFSNAFIFYTAANSTLFASDASQSSVNGAASVTVTPAVTSKLLLTGPSGNATAGVPFQVTLAAADQFGNTTANVAAVVHYSSDDPNSSGLPMDGPLGLSGQQNNTVTLFTAGPRTLNANVTAGATALAGASLTLGLNPAAASKLIVSGVAPNPLVAGHTLGFSVNAQDAFSNSATGYHGSVQLTSTDAAFSPTSYTFVSTDVGSHAFTNSMHTAGNQNITAQDTTNTQLNGTAQLTVIADVANTLTVILPASGKAGVSQNCNVTASDSYGNRAAAYANTVTLSTGDTNAVMPGSYTYVPATDLGRHTFAGVNLHTAGVQQVTASDGNITGVASITVNAADAASLRFSNNPNTVKAGVLFSARVTAYDAFNNVATTYAGNVNFSVSPSGPCTLPVGHTYDASDAGVHDNPNSFALTTAPQMVITATGTPGISGNVTVNVQPGDANALLLSGVQNANAGVLQSLTVKVVDNYNNTVPYTGTVTFDSNDSYPQTLLPADYTFNTSDNGTHTFTNGVKLTKAQNNAYVRAVDTSLSTLRGSVKNLVISGLPASQLLVSGITDPTTAGVTQSPAFTVSATDAYNNIDKTYITAPGAISFSSTDAHAVLPSNTQINVLGQGVVTVSGLQLQTAGLQQSVSAQASSMNVAAQTLAVIANPNISQIAFDPNSVPSTQASCAPVSPAVRVLVYDAFNNLVTQNANSINITAQNGNVFGTPKQPVQNGVATFADLSLDGVGSNKLHATLVGGAINADSNTLTVSGASATPSMMITSTSNGAGCIDLAFAVGACGAPVDLLPRYANSLGGTFATATLPASSPHGLYAVPSSRPIAVRWDSVRDVGHRNGNYNIDIGAHVSGGLQGHASTVISVNNAPTWTSQNSRAPFNGVQALASADFNRDGTPDTVAVDGNVVMVWLGPNGSVTSQSLGVGIAPSSVVAGDINNDGIPDAVMCASSVSGTAVYYALGQADGSLGAPTKNNLFNACGDLALADVNRDGALDAIAFDSATKSMVWNRAYPQGGPTSVAIGLLTFTPIGTPLAADVTGDGIVDVLISMSGNANTLALFPGNGAGFNAPITAHPGIFTPWIMAAGDLDNNGSVDLFVTNGTGYVIYDAMSAAGFGSTGGLGSGNILGITGVSLADADGDGLLDLFARTGSGLVVYAGAGGASEFGTALFTTSLNNPNALSVVDFNHDGLLDLVLNQGMSLERWSNQMPRSCDAAHFGAVVSNATAPLPSGMAVADFDRDGKYDVVVTHGASANNSIEIYRGDGSLGMLKTRTLGSNGPVYGIPATGDLTGDNITDVAVPTADGNVLLFAGDGNGNFAAAVAYPTDPNAGQVVIADINEDGHNDMVVTTSTPSAVDVLLGPNFIKITRPVFDASAVGFSAKRLVLGSVTNGHHVDLALTDDSNFVVGVNDGSGNWVFGQTRSVLGIRGLTLVDITGDGFTDVVTLGNSGNDIYYYTGDGSGLYNGGTSPNPLNCTANDIVAADFNQDGNQDVALLCNSAPTGIAVIYNAGGGYPSGNIFIPTPGALAGIAARDMSSDTYPEVIALSQNANTVLVALNNGLPRPNNDFYGSLYANTDPNTVGAALADMNRDGYLDAVVGNSASAALRVRAGSSNGILGLASQMPTDAQPQFVCVGDMDNDGIVDAVAGNLGGQSFNVEHNTTPVGGAFNVTPGHTSVGVAVSALAVGDLNHDGLLDVVVGTPTGMAVSFNGGGGSFATPVAYPSGPPGATTGLALGDVDNDGWVDVVGTNATGNALTVWLNANSTFSNSSFQSLSNGPTGVALGDVNLDGKLDVVVTLANATRTQIVVGANQGSSNGFTFTTLDGGVRPSGGVVAQDIVLADVDRDGLLDAAVPVRDYGLLLFTGVGAGPYYFTAPTSTWVLGSALRSVAVGDMNHDGRPDLLLVDDVDSEMGMALGR